MDDNLKETVCPVRGLGPSEFNSSSNVGLYGPDSQSQSQSDEKNDFFGSKDTTAYLSTMMPKKYDENQDSQTQDEKVSQDLHNGHNIQNDDKVVKRTVSISELEPVAEGESDTVPIDEKDNDGGGEKTQASENATLNNDKLEKIEVDSPAVTKSEGENMEKDKTHTDNEESQSQDGFRSFLPDENKKPSSKPEASETEENSMDTKHSEGTVGESEGFDLHLSQTQSFLFNTERSASSINCVSDGSKEQDSKTTESEKVVCSDDRSNESSIKKVDSFDEQSNESEIKKVDSSDEHSNQSDIKKVESVEEQSNESEVKKGSSSDESEIKTKESSEQSEVKKMDIVDGESNEELPDKSVSPEKKVDTSGNESQEAMEVDAPPEVQSNSEETVRKPSTTKKHVAFEGDFEDMENEEPEANLTSKVQSACSCIPACHDRLEVISQHLSSACSQLEEFIKSKKRDDKKQLNNFLDMLKEIQYISENKDISGETKISENVFSLEETPKSGRKTATKRKSNDMETPLKATPRKKAAEEKSGKPSEKKTIDFKDLKGLAVFAKWPNSGWYYPGIVEELTAADWKEVTNVTVKFYDGLVRDMKNINILPAYLIPAGSMLCDLEDETEMVVLSCEGSNQNSVDFKLSTKENPDAVLELNFNKLAIKANHMKNIKVQLEPTTDATPKNMHVVSLVSGRRSSRGRTKKDDETEEKTEEKPKVERRSATPKKAATPRRTRN
nr:nucleolin 2-like isoform X2 [Halyomorpha halys]